MKRALAGLGVALAVLALVLLFRTDGSSTGRGDPGKVTPAKATPRKLTPPPRLTGPGPRPAATSPTPQATPAPVARPAAPTVEGSIVVRGRVVEPDGRAVAGARVTLWTTRPGDPSGEAPLERRIESFALAQGYGHVPVELGKAPSNAEGRFEIACAAIRTEEPLRLAAIREVGGVAWVGSLVLGTVSERFEAGDVVVRALPSLRFSVRAQGARVGGAQVRLLSLVDDQLPALEEKLATNGEGLAASPTTAARVHWSVSKPGLATQHGLLDVTSKGAQVEVDLTVESPVSGRIVDADGKPAAGVPVSAYEDGPPLPEPFTFARLSGTATSDPEGRFQLPGLAASRTYAVYAVPSDLVTLPGAAWVEPPENAVELRLVRGATLKAEVRAKGELPEGAFVLLQSREGETWVDGFSTRSTASEVTFARLGPGVYRVVAHAAGRVPAVSEPVTIEVGREPLPLILSLEAGGRGVRGRVLDPGGRPLQGVVVDWNDSHVVGSYTDEAGRFELGDLPLGDVELTFRAPGYPVKKVRVAATDGALDVVLTR